MPLKTTFAALRVLALAVLPLTALPLGGVAPAAAQGLFSPAITVNDSVITGYELQQRAQMLTLLNAPGNPQTLAREQLVDDRLRLQAARAAGFDPSREEILEGMEEFAGRANLSREEFTRALAGGGVAEETFYDFVRAGLAWRQFVQARFARDSAVSEAEVDRALSSSADGSNVRVLLSEIIMPAPPPQAAQVRARAEQIAQTRSEAEFSAYARQFSATATRGSGGRLPWQNLTDLPPALQPIVLGLAPGEVTDPLPIPNAVALFQLRGIEEAGYSAPEIAAVEYAAYYLPGGRTAETLARARVIDSKTDRCDDLYGIAKGQDPSVLQRETLPPAQVPTDIAFELSKLDPGEISTALTRNNGQTLMVLMLCGRTNAVAETADREQLTLGLRNRRVTALADGYLAQLRADARIIER
ncbi:peptidylprolyl isomerase [Litorisediminicola beolgyonensis]|uniref:Parvulin-like PPIase n=1 Tax=Litorisediminicola beolgyonensis TaxID=1173614 RepID=A0ABW3ZK76_9RHOB